MKRFRIILAIWLTLSILGAWCSLSAAEIRNSELWLEVSLATISSLSFRQNGVVRITDASGIYSRELNGNLTFSIDSTNSVSIYGIIGEIAGIVDSAEEDRYYTRESFAWSDSSLFIREEHIALLYDDFNSLASAQNYADANGISRTRVVALPLSGTIIRVNDSSGAQYFFESPLTIQCNNPVRIDNSGLNWTGEFKLKMIGDKLQLNHVISLENYLAGVIQNEIGSGAPLEAMKAQAVASRSHAVAMLLYNRHRDDGYDLCNTTHCQVYRGEHLLNNTILEAVIATHREILIYNGRVVDATYHSACGGKTDASHLIWRGQPTPYLHGTTCIDEADSLDLTQETNLRVWIDTNTIDSGMSSWERASQTWTRSIRTGTLASRAGLSYINRIEILSRGYSGRILALRFIGNTTKTYNSESQIRNVFGGLPSSLFYIDGNYRRLTNNSVSVSVGASIQLKGKGSGHGVGMCQVGTLRRARSGETYDQILYGYYPGTRIGNSWLNNELR